MEIIFHQTILNKITYNINKEYIIYIMRIYNLYHVLNNFYHLLRTKLNLSPKVCVIDNYIKYISNHSI